MNFNMPTMTATEAARHFNRVLDTLERGGDGFEITRNRRPVARIVPGLKHKTALEVFSGLHAALTEEEGREWLEDMAPFDRALAAELKDPWE